jgi:iron complex outermembrane receptor protein
VDAHRTNIGVYADAELNITKQWLVDGAARYENYSDFGSVLTGKLATRYKIADNFNIRGSVSTGFRAPSLHKYILAIHLLPLVVEHWFNH